MRIRYGFLAAAILAAAPLRAQDTMAQDEHAKHAAVAAGTSPPPMPAPPSEDAAMSLSQHDHAAMSMDMAPAQTTATATDHVPPDPPAQPMAPMSSEAMTRAMQMNDAPKFFLFKLDEFERAKSDDAYSTTWNAEAWYGGDFDKLWLRTEGEREAGATEATVEAFWDHAFASFWDWQLGLRRDFGNAPGLGMPARDWAAFGVQGLAPYWVEIEATAYVGEDGRTAARLRAEYEILLTQRLILTPEVEFNFYGKNDRAREIASGLSDAELGLRLRYEIRREFAPYIGIVRKYRADADSNAPGLPAIERSETWLVAGFRLLL